VLLTKVQQRMGDTVDADGRGCSASASTAARCGRLCDNRPLRAPPGRPEVSSCHKLELQPHQHLGHGQSGVRKNQLRPVAAPRVLRPRGCAHLVAAAGVTTLGDLLTLELLSDVELGSNIIGCEGLTVPKVRKCIKAVLAIGCWRMCGEEEGAVRLHAVAHLLE
jgi:hypothetical protein